MGDFFQYAIDKPVSLPRQKSALLPLVGKDVATVVQHMRKMKELCEHGVETSATVERNEVLPGFTICPSSLVSQRASMRCELAHRYTDGAGAAHTGVYAPPFGIRRHSARLDG
jgi:hypothetical protein